MLLTAVVAAHMDVVSLQEDGTLTPRLLSDPGSRMLRWPADEDRSCVVRFRDIPCTIGSIGEVSGWKGVLIEEALQVLSYLWHSELIIKHTANNRQTHKHVTDFWLC